jgi:3-methyladenine DNA glycosylase/8-oxoguanine DNA glycosylase
MFITKPQDFNYKTTVYSHGWYQLAPFEFDEENRRLKYVFQSETNEKPVSAIISETDKKVKIEFSDKNISQQFKKKIVENIKHILRIDEDLSKFYQIIDKKKEFAWIKKVEAGRLLRSPTVFEDLVKTICTTNCSWALTKKMTANLVEKLGEETSNGEKTFPTAEAMAKVNADFYRKEIRSGYRSEYLGELAKAVADGKINPEKWLAADLPTDELKKEMKKIKGVGNYAAESLLKLLGRYDGLALDSFLRSEFCKKYNNGNSCTDKEIKKFYERFGEWRGLVMWFDMSKRWLD